MSNRLSLFGDFVEGGHNSVEEYCIFGKEKDYEQVASNFGKHVLGLHVGSRRHGSGRRLHHNMEKQLCFQDGVYF